MRLSAFVVAALVAGGVVGASALGAAGNGIERVSVATDGTLSSYDTGSPVISGNGRRVLFLGPAGTGLAPEPTGNGVWGVGAQLFVRDRLDRTTRLASLGPGGVAPEGMEGADHHEISDDGRFVVFESGSGLLPCLFGRCGYIGISYAYLHDLETGAFRPVAVAPTGLPIPSSKPTISGDGRYIAYYDQTSYDLALLDRTTGRVERIGVSGANVQLDRDASVITFDDRQQCFLLDRATGRTERLDVATDGTPGNGSTNCQASISDDGQRAAFHTNATNLGGADNGRPHLYVRDRPSGRTIRVDIDPAGQGPMQAAYGSISGSGRFVAFSLKADAVYVRDIDAGTTRRVDVGLACGKSEFGPTGAEVSISDDGRFVAFVSRSTNLVAGDERHDEEVFVRDMLVNCSPVDENPNGVERLGSGANDVLVGTAHPDQLVGMGGNDVLRGLAGDDTLDGGTGADVLQGGAGSDELTGGPHRDVLEGGTGNDRIFASDRVRDVIRCGAGNDVVYVDKRDRPARDCEIKIRG